MKAKQNIFILMVLVLTIIADQKKCLAQNLTEFEGTTQISLNSTDSMPQLLIVEEDSLSPSKSSIQFINKYNPGATFRINTRLNTSVPPRFEIRYNDLSEIWYEPIKRLFGIHGALRLTSPPAVSEPGMIKYDNDTRFKGYNGTDWVTFGLWGEDSFGPRYIKTGSTFASIFSSDNSIAGIGLGGTSGIQSFILYNPGTGNFHATANLANDNMLVLEGTNQRVGINTSTPSGQLEVSSNSSSTSPTLSLEEVVDNDYARLFFRNFNNPSDKWAISGRVGNSTDHVLGLFYNGAHRWVYNESAGGMGIGTTSPDEILHLNFTGYNGLKIEGDGTGDARLWLDNQAGNHYFFDDVSDANALKISAANAFAINVNGTERLRINESGGEVQIGGTDTSAKLYVNNDSKTYSVQVAASGTGLKYGVRATATALAGTDNKYALRGQISNNMGTGNAYGAYGSASTSNANFYGIYSSGNMHYSGALTNSSDSRVKKNIQNMEPVLQKVMQIETKTFEFDRETYDYANFATGVQHGFIAQNIQSLFPTLVVDQKHSFETSFDESGDPNFEQLNILGMKTMEMIPILTKAIQEQQILIEALRDEIEVLKAEK